MRKVSPRPGIRKFRTTSHQARRVITSGERVSGRRIGWLPMITSPEPAARPDPAAEEERMLAEASADTSEVVRRDPEEVAIELLQNELGARRIEKG